MLALTMCAFGSKFLGVAKQPRNSTFFLTVRFSLRSSLLVITLSCIYWGGWEITKNRCVDGWARDPDLRCSTPMPYLAVVDELDSAHYRYLRRGYFCCLSLRVPLPFAWQCRDRRPIVMGGVIPKIIIQEGEETRLGVEVP